MTTVRWVWAHSFSIDARCKAFSREDKSSTIACLLLISDLYSLSGLIFLYISLFLAIAVSLCLLVCGFP